MWCANVNSTVLSCFIVLGVCGLVVEASVVLARRMQFGRQQWPKLLDTHDYRHLVAKVIGQQIASISMQLAVIVALGQGVSVGRCSLLLVVVPWVEAVVS